MAPNGIAYHIDWICSNTSNVNVANNKDWFTTFTEFPTKLGSLYSPANSIEVLGIGDVELELVRSRRPSGKKQFCTIVLKDVLYAPSFVTNIFAMTEDPGYTATLGFEGKVIDRATAQNVGMIDGARLCKLWLKGQARGKSSLDPNQLYIINAMWPNEERGRWAAFNRSSSSSRYTDDAKAWLTEYYGNEFKFLQQHGLSIYKDEDRDEGAQIDDDEGEDEVGNQWLADIEANPASHVADCHFSHGELDWIEKSYGHSGDFMMSYGLKPWNDEDCEEAAAIARAFVEDPDKDDEEE